MAKKWDSNEQKQIDFNYLKSILNNSKVQVENNALYQVIFQLIKNAQQNKDITVEEITNLITKLSEISDIINNISTGLSNLDYLTSKNDFPTLPNSRQLLPGSNITFDDITDPHQRIVNATGGGGSGSGAGFGIDLLSEGSDEPMMMPPGTPGSAGATGAPGAAGPAVYLDFEAIEPDPPIPGSRGLDGAQGLTGPQGPIGLGIDGIDGEEGMSIPGIPGQPGTAGSTGATGPAGPAGLGLDGDTGDDGFPIPGTPGQAGNPGSVGPQGPIGFAIDGIDGEEYHIPGPTGPAGGSGSTGPAGLGAPGLDGDVGEDAIPYALPGPIGLTGTAGKDGIQPKELITLIGRGYKRIWLLEQALGVNYRVPELGGPDVPSDDELIALEEVDLGINVINAQRVRTFGITIDGGGSVITTGIKQYIQIPYTGIITGWTVLATDGLTGSITIDIYKDNYPSFPPTAVDSITGGNKPNISSSNKNTSTSLTGWGITFNAGDIFGFNVDSATTLTRIIIEITTTENVELTLNTGVGNLINSTLFASPPTTPSTGDLDFYKDSFYIGRYSGSAWVPWGPIFPCVEPNTLSWAWVNQGTASIVTTNGGVYLLAPQSAAVNLRTRVKSAPSTPYTATAMFIPSLMGLDFTGCGICFRNSGTGALASIALVHNGGQWTIDVNKWTSATVFNSQYSSTVFQTLPPLMFLRIADDGINRISSLSFDGINFKTIHSVARTDFMTADQVGFFANSQNATWDAAMTLLSWKEA